MPLLDDVITYLEMREKPSAPPVPAPSVGKLALMRAEECTVSFYRYLYETVGTPWLWFERRLLDDADAGGADPEADDRDFRALCRRRAGRVFRAGHGGAGRDRTVLFRADSGIHRPPARSVSAAGGDRPGLVAADPAALGAYPQPTTTRRRSAITSGPGLSSMTAGSCASRTRAPGAFCRAICPIPGCRRSTDVPIPAACRRSPSRRRRPGVWKKPRSRRRSASLPAAAA